MTATTICFNNQKGGVGKTVDTSNIAAALALGVTPAGQAGRGRLRKTHSDPARAANVLVVDLDRQMSLGDTFKAYGTDRATFLAAIACDDVNIDDALIPSPVPLPRGRIDVLPARPYDYERAVNALPGYPDTGINILRMALEQLRERYDYILLDTRPELSHLTAAAMAASDGVVIPVTSEVTTALHVDEVGNFIDWVAKTSGVDITPYGILRSQWQPSFESRQVDQILPRFGIHVFESIIPSHRQVSKAFMMTTGPVVLSFPKAPATKAFIQATAEILEKAGK